MKCGPTAEVEEGAVQLKALLGRPSLTAHPATDLEQAVQQLVASELVHLLFHPYGAIAAKEPADLASPLNRLLLSERIESAGALTLAPRVAGTQVMLAPADRLALLALVGRFGAAWARVRAAGQRITQEGRLVESAAQLARLVEMRAEAIGLAMIRHLRQLGVVESVA